MLTTFRAIVIDAEPDLESISDLKVTLKVERVAKRSVGSEQNRGRDLRHPCCLEEARFDYPGFRNKGRNMRNRVDPCRKRVVRFVLDGNQTVRFRDEL